MRVNRTGLADVLGVNPSTVDNWIRRGMPYVSKGDGVNGSWEFETKDCIKWRIDLAVAEAMPEPDAEAGQVTAKELQRRKLQAETEIVEIELAKKKGLVVLIEEAAACLGDAVATVRAQLLNLPRRAAPLVVGETDETVVKDLLENEIDEILQELHKGAFRTTEGATGSDSESDPEEC